MVVVVVVVTIIIVIKWRQVCVFHQHPSTPPCPTVDVILYHCSAFMLTSANTYYCQLGIIHWAKIITQILQRWLKGEHVCVHEGCRSFEVKANLQRTADPVISMAGS